MTKAFADLTNIARSIRKAHSLVNKFSAKPLRANDPMISRRTGAAIDNANRVQFWTMEFARGLKLLQAVDKIDNQRNEFDRLETAVHLQRLDLTQAMFSIALVEEEGKLYLLDGNTRKLMLLTRWGADYFTNLHFTVYLYATKADALAAYRTFDSRQARKSGRNDIEGSFRQAGFPPESFSSKVLRTGAVVTAIKNLARASLGSAGEANVEKAVGRYAQYFAMLDEVNLEEGNPPSGALVAAVSLLECLPQSKRPLVVAFVKGIKLAYTDSQTEVPAPVFLAAKQDADYACRNKGQGTSGDAAGKLTAPLFVDSFIDYVMLIGRRGQKAMLLTRAESAEVYKLRADLQEKLADKVKDKSVNAA